MPPSVLQFIQRIDASGLMTADAVSEFVSNLSTGRQPGDGHQLLKELLKDGILNPFQVEELTSDRNRSLVLGNYILLDKLGQGGMGVVYKAFHRRMDRFVALKVLSQEAVKTPSLVERFHREVKAAAKLHHPNIVAAFDADESRGEHFLVMEFVEGQDLAKVVRMRHPLPIASAIEYVVQAARGLDYAHRHGIVHRDIKPANLLLTDEGELKILDMGLARFEGPVGELLEQLTTSGLVVGTVDYMSPEQAEDTRRADARSDIYSLGCTLFVLLAGRIPFPAETAMKRLLAHRETQPPDLRCLRDDVPSELNAIVQRMLAKKSAERFASMSEVEAALRMAPFQADATQIELHRPVRPVIAIDSSSSQTVENTSPNVASNAVTVDYVAHLDAADAVNSSASTSIFPVKNSSADHSTSIAENPATSEPPLDAETPVLQQRNRRSWLRMIAAVMLGVLAILVVWWPREEPKTVSPPQASIDLPEPPRTNKVVAKSRSVDLLPLVNSGTIGDGDFSDVKVEDSTLTLDATNRSQQLWLNFQGVVAEHLAIQTRFRIDPALLERDGFLKLVFMKRPECNALLVRNRGSLRFQLYARFEDGPIATAPVPMGLERDFIDMAFVVNGNQLQMVVDGKVVLQAPRIATNAGYVAIAASGWKVEFDSPHVVMFESKSEPEPAKSPWIDLLERFHQPDVGQLPAGWTWHDGQLLSSANVETNNLPLRQLKATSYCLETEVTARNADDAFYLVLPVGRHVCLFGVNTHPKGDSVLAGFGYVNGKGIRDNDTRVSRQKLARGTRYRISVVVGIRGDRVALVGSLNGQTIATYVGPVSSLSVPVEYRWPDPGSVGLGTVNSAYTVHSVKLLETRSGAE